MSSQNTIEKKPITSNGLFSGYSNSLWMKLCIWVFGGALIVGAASQAYLLVDQKIDPSTKQTEAMSSSFNTRGLQTDAKQETLSKSFSLPSMSDNESTTSLEQWSPALLKLGLSFFVGLSIGFVVKTFFKVTLFFAGIVFLILFGLSYVGIVDVRWEMIETFYQNTVTSLSGQIDAFKDFISGSLPSAGSFGFGLLTALRRR